MALTEFSLIQRYFTHPARGAVLGVGDDAALLRPRPGMELVVTADMLLEGRHFAPGADPVRLGHKSLAVNLSDLAAMGARPRWALLSLALPRADARWLADFSRGFMALARRHGTDLVGGDTTRGPLAISVQAMGEVPAGTALRRDGARPGDDVWVSGTLGEAALALAARSGRVRLERAERARCERRLHVPQPRVALGMALRGIARSAIDVSDGLMADLGHICERSGVRAVLRLGALPAGPAVKRRLPQRVACEALLAGGDDYELVFTAPPGRRAALARLGARLGIALTRVGEIRPRKERPDVTVLDEAGRRIEPPATGYRHF